MVRLLLWMVGQTDLMKESRDRLADSLIRARRRSNVLERLESELEVIQRFPERR